LLIIIVKTSFKREMAEVGSFPDEQEINIYIMFMHSISILNTIVLVVIMWLLIRHTPPSMLDYRKYLFNLMVIVLAC
jgi:hypothetical protein